MKPQIISDSSCDLPSDFLKKDGINFSLVPLKIIVGDNEYIDNDTLNINELLDAIKSTKTASFSSCPSPEDFAAPLRTHKESFIVTMTSGLSGTYNSARVARDMILDKDSESKIGIFDSLATSPLMILMIMKLRDYINTETMNFETICEKLAIYQKTLTFRFVIQDLSNLIKTGRMNRITGIVASALSIFPILSSDDKGEIQVLEKVRGAKKVISRLASMVEEKVKTIPQFPVVITHCNNPTQAEQLKALLEKRFNLKEIYIFPMRGLASFYSGDQGLLLAY
jgi:DegV family protein with EDD domain